MKNESTNARIKRFAETVIQNNKKHAEERGGGNGYEYHDGYTNGRNDMARTILEIIEEEENAKS
ncbi:hypothetical protein NSQ26_05835 [Bacillus sp. FSL W7-1360]